MWSKTYDSRKKARQGEEGPQAYAALLASSIVPAATGGQQATPRGAGAATTTAPPSAPPAPPAPPPPATPTPPAPTMEDELLPVAQPWVEGEDDFAPAAGDAGALVLVGEKRSRPTLVDELLREAAAARAAKLARANAVGRGAHCPVPAAKAHAGPGRPCEWVLRAGVQLLTEEEFKLLSTEGLRQLWAEYYIHSTGLEAPRRSKSSNRAYLKRKLVAGGV